MVRYLTMITFTTQGIEGIQDSPKRASSFASRVEQAGGRVLCRYWSLGDADGCFVFEAPSEQVASQLLIQLEKEGNVRTTSRRVFDESEFVSIVNPI